MASRGVKGIDIQANLSLDISALISSLEKDLSAKTLGIEIKPSLANFDAIKKALAGLSGEIEIISPNQAAFFANLLRQLITVGDRLKSITNFSPIFDNATASAKKLNQEIASLKDSLTSINRRRIEIISQKQLNAIATALADIREIDSLLAKNLSVTVPKQARTEQPDTKPSPVNEPDSQSIPQPPDIDPQLGLKQFEEISLAIKNLQESIKQIPSDEFLSASNRIDEEVTRLRAELEGIALSLPKGLGRKIGAQKAALTRISKQIDSRINIPPVPVDVTLQAPKIQDLDPIQVDSRIESVKAPKLESIAIDLKIEAPKIPDLDPIQVDSKVESVEVPKLDPVPINIGLDAPKVSDLDPIQIDSKVESIKTPDPDPIPVDIKVQTPKIPTLDPLQVDSRTENIQPPKVDLISVDVKIEAPKIPDLDPIQVDSNLGAIQLPKVDAILLDIKVKDVEALSPESINVEPKIGSIEVPKIEPILIDVKVNNLDISSKEAIQVDSKVGSIEAPTIESISVDVKVETPKIPSLDPISVDSNLRTIQPPKVELIPVDLKLQAPKIPDLEPIQVDSKIESVEVPKLDPVAIDIRLDTPKVSDLDPIQVDSKIESVQSPDLDSVLVDVKVDAPKVLDLDPIQVDSKVGSIEPPKVELIQVDVEVNDLDIPKPDPIFVDADIKSVDIPKVEPINIDLKIENIETPSTKTIPIDATVVTVEIPKVDPIFVDARVDKIKPPDIEPIAIDLKIDPLNAPAIEPQIEEDIKSVDAATEKLFKDTAKQFDLYREIVNQVIKESNLSDAASSFLGEIPKLTPLPSNAPKDAAASYNVKNNLIRVRQELLNDIAQNIISPLDLSSLVHELRHAIQSSFGKVQNTQIDKLKFVELLRPLEGDLTSFQQKAILDGALRSTQLFVEQIKSLGIDVNSPQSQSEIDIIQRLEFDAYGFQALYTKKIIESLKGVIPSLEKAIPDFDNVTLNDAVSGLITQYDMSIAGKYERERAARIAAIESVKSNANPQPIEPEIKENIVRVDAATEKLFKDTAKQFDLYREIVNQVVKESNLSSIAKDFLGDVPKLTPLPASAPKKAAAQYSPDQNLILVRQELLDDIANNIISPADLAVLVHELRHAVQSSFGNFADADIKETGLINLLKPIQAELTQFQVDSIVKGAVGSTELYVEQLKSAGIDVNSPKAKANIDFIQQLEDDAYTFQALYTKKILDSLKGVVPSLEKATPDFDRLKLAQSVSGLITEADLAINQAIGGVNKEIDRAKTKIKTVGNDLPRFAIEEVNKAVAGIGNVPEIGNVANRINRIGEAGSKVVGIFKQLKSAFKDSFSTFIALQLSNIFDNIFFALQDTARQIQTISTQFEGFANSINFVSGGLEQGAKNFNAIAKSARDLKVALVPAIEGYTQLAAATQGTNLEKDTIGISKAILQAGRAYSITTDRLNNATLAIGQIAGKAVVSQEELRQQLSEALPGALQVASRAFGVTTAELNKLVEAGLTADEFLPRFARQLRRETAFAAEQGSKTLGAAVQNLANARDTLFVAIGQQASPALIGLYDGLAVALNSVAGAIAPVVSGFVNLAKIGAAIAVIQGLSLGFTALKSSLGFASLALKALILDLQALTFQSFSAGIASATAGIANLVKTAATSKVAIEGLKLGIAALAGSILIGVVEAGLAVDDLNKKTRESADTITKFRDDLNRANAKPIELGVAKNLDQEFRDSQSVFIKLANLISVFQRLATGGDVIDNLNAVRSQKFFNTIEQGNAVLESSIKLRADDARGINVQAAAVELAGDQLARQLSIAKDSLAVTDAERQAKDNLVKQLEREIDANRRLEDSLAGIDKAYGDVLRAVNKRIAGSKRAEAEALAEIARLEVKGTELQESLEKRKAEATKNRISEELQAQQDLLKSLQSRQDATTSTKTIDEIEKVNKRITDLTKEQANSEIETEKAKQAEKIAIIEEASQKALSVSKEAEQERLIELQKLYNADLISKEDLELEKLKVTQKATDAQLKAVEEEIKAINSADISQRQKELKLRELREKSSDLVLQALQKQKEVEESLFNIAKAQIERLAKVQTDRIELFNEELDLKAKVIDSDKKAQLESEKLTNLLTIQEKSLERQLTIVSKRNELLKARSDASLFVSTAETDRLNRALEIVRKINSGDIGSQKELKALKQELSDLGVSGTVREKDLIDQIAEQETKTRELKLKALETEQRIQSQILELEIQKTEQAQKRALIEAQAQVRTAQVEFAKAPIEQAKTDLAAQKAVIESTKELAIAQKELSQASGNSEKKQAQEAIALAQRRLEIAQQELTLSRDTTSIDLARERLGLAVENLREQEKISQDQNLINGYQREGLKLTQAQAKAQLEIENRTNRAANRTNRAIGEASRSQGFVADPIVERRRQDEIDAIKAKGRLERESNADTQKAIAEARNRFNQEDIENREKAIKAQGAITVPVNLEPLPLTDLKRQVEGNPPLDIPARLKIDNNGNLLDSQALNVPTIPQPQALGNRGQNGLAQLGLDILNQLKDLGLKIPNVRPEVNATFNNQFSSTDQKELLRKARNQNLADIESVFANVVGAF